MHLVSNPLTMILKKKIQPHVSFSLKKVVSWIVQYGHQVATGIAVRLFLTTWREDQDMEDLIMI